MKTIDKYNFSGKKAIIRVDFNVPLNANFEIGDDTRIRAAIPTIQKIRSGGGAVILMSHLGRPKEGPEDRFSLKHLVTYLSETLGVDIQFANDCIGHEAVEKAQALQAGQVLLLENLRFYKEETKGDVEFARKLSKLADVYINDAFGTAHRAHASTTIIARFFPDNKMFGYNQDIPQEQEQERGGNLEPYVEGEKECCSKDAVKKEKTEGDHRTLPGVHPRQKKGDKKAEKDQYS